MPKGDNFPSLKGGASTDLTNRFDELYTDDTERVRMVITVNPPESLPPTLEALVRQKPSVRGREADIACADFDLRDLLA